MAKKHRYIQTDIWNETWFSEFPDTVKLVYLYLLTNPGTNNAGVYIRREKAIAFECGIEDVSKELEYLKEKKEIIIYGDWVAVLRHPEFQKWETNLAIAQAIISDIDTIPEGLVKLLTSSDYRYPPIKKSEWFQAERKRVSDYYAKRKERNAQRQSERKKTGGGAGLRNEDIPFGTTDP